MATLIAACLNGVVVSSRQCLVGNIGREPGRHDDQGKCYGFRIVVPERAALIDGRDDRQGGYHQADGCR
ncbi:MAG: hypothetical protein J0626_07225 [Rhodospirillaceae bacterium]|nr:hypothetical protein [Rhodospirillaceae bacterium]